jgi:hypothetical protein
MHILGGDETGSIGELVDCGTHLIFYSVGLSYRRKAKGKKERKKERNF